MNKTLKELNLEDDFLFAKVMSDKEICKELLENILEIEIEKVEMVEEQKTIDLLLESKGISLMFMLKMKIIQFIMLKCSEENIRIYLRD